MKIPVFIGLLMGGLVVASTNVAPFVPVAAHAAGPLPRQAYVWQRDWGEHVPEAMQDAAPSLDAFIVLAAEVAWEGQQPSVARIALDWDALRTIGCPIGLALRIGPHPDPITLDGDSTRLLTALAKELLGEATDAGLPVAEFHLDFDAADRQVGEYRTWVSAIREVVAPVPLTLTVLPSWLYVRDFKQLAHAADGYVLQVHSLERPTTVDAPVTLCDPERTADWIARADRIGVAFRLALPTYGYRIVFGADGTFEGLLAEGPTPELAADVQIREVRTDPAAMAALVRDLTAANPRHLQGIIWYRLPVEGDRLNWSWPTLAAVIEGRSPTPHLTITRTTEGGLTDLTLTNTGEADALFEGAVQVRWNNDAPLAADGYRGFAFAPSNHQSARLLPPHPLRIPPGAQLPIGWLRFATATEVSADVE